MIPQLVPKALLASIVLGLLLPITGRHLLLARSVLLGLAAPQVSMAGIALVLIGTTLGWSWCAGFEGESTRTVVGALILSIPTVLLLAFVQRMGRQLSEAWLGTVYVASIAATNLMLSSDAVAETYLSDLFHGRLILISDQALIALAVTMVVTSFMAVALRSRFLLVLIDPDFADVAGVRATGWLMLLALLNGVVIGVCVSAVGPLVTFSLLLLPTVTASAFSKSLRIHLVASMLTGVMVAIGGYRLAYRYDLPLGDCIVALAATILVGTQIAKIAAQRIRRRFRKKRGCERG